MQYQCDNIATSNAITSLLPLYWTQISQNIQEQSIEESPILNEKFPIQGT